MMALVCSLMMRNIYIYISCSQIRQTVIILNSDSNLNHCALHWSTLYNATKTEKLVRREAGLRVGLRTSWRQDKQKSVCIHIWILTYIYVLHTCKNLVYWLEMWGFFKWGYFKCIWLFLVSHMWHWLFQGCGHLGGGLSAVRDVDRGAFVSWGLRHWPAVPHCEVFWWVLRSFFIFLGLETKKEAGE